MTGTTISPWVVTMEALEPFICKAPEQVSGTVKYSKVISDASIFTCEFEPIDSLHVHRLQCFSVKQRLCSLICSFMTIQHRLCILLSYPLTYLSCCITISQDPAPLAYLQDSKRVTFDIPLKVWMLVFLLMFK